MSKRLVNNFIKQQKKRINTASQYMGVLVQTSCESLASIDISVQEALTSVGIAYLRFTGNNADKALAEIICGIMILLGNVSSGNPIGKTGDNQKEVEALIMQHQSATDLLEPIFALIGSLLKSTCPEVNIAGLDLAKCLQAYTELLVYQDRRRIPHKGDFLDFINVLIYETKNGLPTNPEAIVLTPPPSPPILPPSIEYIQADKSRDQPPEGTAERGIKVAAKRSTGLKISTTFDEILQKLNDLIGLGSVKHEVEQTVNEIKYQKLLAKQGESPVTISRHMVFTGNPGTGKTTIARILGEIFKHLGVLSIGHMVETDRAGLVAGYLGQTAIKTDEVITSALGGILFIDEAYALTTEDRDQFGQEAIDTLLKRMEDNRDNLIVIVAGYPVEMERFINANPGLQSRFTKYIHFDDYNASELRQIFELLLKSSGHKMSSDSSNHLDNIFEEMDRRRDQKFGNGRTVRNLYEKTIRNVATRVIETMPESIKTVLPEDISNQDVHAVLRIANSVAISNATSEGIEDKVVKAEHLVDSDLFINQDSCVFYETLGRSLYAFINQQQGKSENELTQKMESFISDSISREEQFLPVLNECARIISQFDGQLSLSNQHAWEQFVKHRIQEVFSQQSTEIASALIRGYLNARCAT